MTDSTTKQRFLPFDERERLVTEWRMANPGEYDAISTAWFGAVNNRPEYVTEAAYFFREYLFYEYADNGGVTIAERAAKDDPTIADWVGNEVYTRIRVREWMPDGMTTEVEDLFTGDVFELVDPDVWAHFNWGVGSLGVRITRVGDTSVVAGIAHLHDNAERFNRRLYRGPNMFTEEVAYVIGDHGNNADVWGVERNWEE